MNERPLESSARFKPYMQLKSLLSKCAFVCSAVFIGVTFLPMNASAQPFAYVANFVSNSVSVINTATNATVATVNVGFQPDAVAVTPDGTRVYVANQSPCGLGPECDPFGPSNVSVIDAATNTVVATVTVGPYPLGVAITPDGTRAYVTNNDGSISVISTATNLVIDTIIGTSGPRGIAFTPDGSRAYVANDEPSSVTVINTSTNTFQSRIPLLLNNLDSATMGIALTPDGTRAYVTNFCFPYTDTQLECANSPSYVSVINTATNTDFLDIPLGLGVWALAVTPDGKRVYVVDTDTNSVSVLDTALNTVVTTISLGSQRNGASLAGIAFTPDGKWAYVSDFDSGVKVINTATNTVTATIGGGGYPAAVAIGGQSATSLLMMLRTQFLTGSLPDVGHSFSDQLTLILNDIASNNGATCVDLQTFIGHVNAQAGKKLTAAQAASILQTVSGVAPQLGCTM